MSLSISKADAAARVYIRSGYAQALRQSSGLPWYAVRAYCWVAPGPMATPTGPTTRRAMALAACPVASSKAATASRIIASSIAHLKMSGEAAVGRLARHVEHGRPVITQRAPPAGNRRSGAADEGVILIELVNGKKVFVYQMNCAD